jgi:ribosomal protein S18 acetylase RimI-like enzyme
MRIVELTLDRYDEVLALMRSIPGVTVCEADSKPAMARYLERNPGLSFIAEVDGKIVGCALCGHDGRRGYLQHVLVVPEYRKRGIANTLVTRCLDELEKLGITKTHIDVFVTNKDANAYWKRRGWKLRDDIFRYSYIRSKNDNA